MHEQRDERLIHRLHPVEADRRLHLLEDVLGVALFDQLGDARRVLQDLDRRGQRARRSS